MTGPNDNPLYELWKIASREAGQPQCTYPQLDTLRRFAQECWLEGFGAAQTEEQVVECPYVR